MGDDTKVGVFGNGFYVNIEQCFLFFCGGYTCSEGAWRHGVFLRSTCMDDWIWS